MANKLKNIFPTESAFLDLIFLKYELHIKQQENRHDLRT